MGNGKIHWEVNGQKTVILIDLWKLSKRLMILMTSDAWNGERLCFDEEYWDRQRRQLGGRQQKDANRNIPTIGSMIREVKQDMIENGREL